LHQLFSKFSSCLAANKRIRHSIAEPESFPSMDPDQDRSQPVSLVGEVVEILEGPGQRTAKVAVLPSNLLDIPVEKAQDTHLGDSVVIDARVTIRRVQPAPELASPGRNSQDDTPQGNPLQPDNEGEQHER
jgi:hypothetical protein